MDIATKDQVAKIREANDLFRTMFGGDEIVLTATEG
jgi:hypothetical protein